MIRTKQHMVFQRPVQHLEVYHVAQFIGKRQIHHQHYIVVDEHLLALKCSLFALFLTGETVLVQLSVTLQDSGAMNDQHVEA